MLGSSRESLASVRESLDARRREPGFDAVSADLFAVADLLGREKTLRVALADAGQPADGRAALAASVLGSRISPLALDV
ncbi:MAG: F0F1 ATP synthase subunit delta, partial [Actinomycetes bacterium]